MLFGRVAVTQQCAGDGDDERDCRGEDELHYELRCGCVVGLRVPNARFYSFVTNRARCPATEPSEANVLVVLGAELWRADMCARRIRGSSPIRREENRTRCLSLQRAHHSCF